MTIHTYPPLALPSFTLPGLLGRATPPIDVVISGNTTLTERINYFRNLTVNSGITLTGIAGGTIIIVEGTLTNAGVISVNALGGLGGALNLPGYGGGAWGRGFQTQTVRTAGGFISTTTPSASVPYAVAPKAQRSMATGGVGQAGAGGAGGAWPFATGGMIDALQQAPLDYMLLLALWELIQENMGDDNATTGSIGGGGGGGGRSGANNASGAGGVFGMGGAANDAGGSGFGGGGGGGSGTGGTGVAGGRGGGVLLLFCRTLDNTGGVISADGGAGSNSGTAGGGGGGGGGGAVTVSYEALTAAGTVRASGGAGGTSSSGSAGGAGGAGAAVSVKIRSGS